MDNKSENFVKMDSLDYYSFKKQIENKRIFTSTRMAIMKWTDNKCWQRCGEIGTFIT